MESLLRRDSIILIRYVLLKNQTTTHFEILISKTELWV